MRVPRPLRCSNILLLGLVLLHASAAGVVADDDPPEDLMMFSVTMYGYTPDRKTGNMPRAEAKPIPISREKNIPMPTTRSVTQRFS